MIVNFENKENTYPIKSISTVVEISKKITELLEQNNYNNKDMLITKEHIKHNLAQLIVSSNIKSSIHYKTNITKIKYSDRHKHETSRKF